MFSSTTPSTLVCFGRNAMYLLLCLCSIPSFFLLHQQKYHHDVQWALPAFALAAWSAFSSTIWREYAPSHLMARWDAVALLASPLFYCTLRVLQTGDAFAMLFTVFGAPLLTIIAAYLLVGRTYNKRNSDLARYPHMAAYYEREDAENRLWWINVAKFIGTVIAYTAATFALMAAFYFAGIPVLIFFSQHITKFLVGGSVLGLVGGCTYLGYEGWMVERKANYKYAGHAFFWGIYHFIATTLFIIALVNFHKQGMALVAMHWVFTCVVGYGALYL